MCCTLCKTKTYQRKKILQPAEEDNAQHCEETHEDKGDGEQHAEGTTHNTQEVLCTRCLIVFFFFCGDNGDIVKYYTGLPNLGTFMV